jgi:hypothetical protein
MVVLDFGPNLGRCEVHTKQEAHGKSYCCAMPISMSIAYLRQPRHRQEHNKHQQQYVVEYNPLFTSVSHYIVYFVVLRSTQYAAPYVPKLR